MPDAGLAERLLSLVMRPERAAAVIGDLLERVPRRGQAWFWLALTRTGVACVAHDVMAAPLSLAFGAAIAWFAYMFVVILLGLAVQLVLLILGLVFNVAAAHTGVELVAGALTSFVHRIAPSGLASPAELLVIVTVAPYLTGTRLAQIWRERAIALVAVVGVVWFGLVTLVPLAAVAHRVGRGHLPVILLFMLAGVARAMRPGISSSAPAPPA